jgi:hypothetical protein
MTFAAVSLAILRFCCWEASLFAVSIVLARALPWSGARRVEEKILTVLGIEIALESSFAALFSFTHTNGAPAYWIATAMCALAAVATARGREALTRACNGLRAAEIFHYPRTAALFAGLLAPLIFLSFRPVQEADSINYLHYLIDWMANRATPYAFATNYVAFWELSFLPSWTVTGLDLFFPLLALKAVVLLALAAWLAGRELGLRRHLLLWTVFGAILLRHLWWESSGVPTLKNDVLHGAGFVLLTLVVLRAARRRLGVVDAALFALGAAFALVKYTGVFVVAIAAAMLLFLEWRRPRKGHGTAIAVFSGGLFALLTSGHYYLHNWLLYGSPFYPFQINFAFLHLPGVADLSGTSILYNLRNPGVWRAFFLPAGGISSLGVLFPPTLAAALAVSVWMVARAVFWRPEAHRSLTVAARLCVPSRDRKGAIGTPIAKWAPDPRALPWAAALLLAGWFLYFRSVYSAGTVPGDIGFVLGLNTIRYVIGVLAVSELLLVALLWRFPRLALSLVVLNAASRAAILYAKLPLGSFPVATVIPVSVAVCAVILLLARYRLATALAAALALVVGGPFIVERNRAAWLTAWVDLKPALAAARADSLGLLVYDDWGYFAGHIFAAGNPVHPAVRALFPADLDALPSSARPRYLAALPTPASAAAAARRLRQAPDFVRWGYTIAADSGLGVLLERTFPPIPVAADTSLDAWYAPLGTVAISGMPVLAGHVLRNGEIVADPSGGLVRLDPRGRQPLQPAPGVVIRLRNCGDLKSGRPSGAVYQWESGRWTLTEARSAAGRKLPSPSWYTSMSDGGRFVQELLADGSIPFVRLRAENDARWLIYSAAYPDGLPDGVPVTVRAVVRCPRGCSLSTAGHSPELDRSVRSDDWTPLNLNFAFQRNGRPQHYAVGMAACHRGDWFDLRSFELRTGVYPYE